MKFHSLCTSEIVFEDKESFCNRIYDLPVHNIVLVLDEALCGFIGLNEFVVDLQIRFAVRWIKTVPSNPTQADVYNALMKLEEFKPELIFAIGGGSAIDLAKAVSAMYSFSERILEIDEITSAIKTKSYQSKNEFLDIIAVPTTAGTGSEVTQWATIWDVSREAKYSIDTPELKPKMAAIVTDFTLSLPKKTVLSTALDAVSHAAEAFWSKHTNPVAGDFALQAIRLITENLPVAMQNLSCYEVRKKLCRGALLAGLAFSQTRTTACHSISYPMTFLFGVEHGFAAAMTLEPIAMINRSAVENMEELLRLFDPFGGIQNWIDNVCGNLLSLRLNTFGISEDDIPVLVEKAFTAGRMDNNPVDITPKQVEGILRSLLR